MAFSLFADEVTRDTVPEPWIKRTNVEIVIGNKIAGTLNSTRACAIASPAPLSRSTIPRAPPPPVTKIIIPACLENCSGQAIGPPPVPWSYDNCGLIVGDANTEVKGALITLDCIEEVIDEAIETGCNLVVAHHPIIFSGLRKWVLPSICERKTIPFSSISRRLRRLNP